MNSDRCCNTFRQQCRVKGSGKEVKIQELSTEVQRIWNLKCTVIPAIIGATGKIKRSLRKNFETIPGTHSIESLQKTAVLGTSRVIR